MSRKLFQRPRSDVIALIGEANQPLPVLVLTEDALAPIPGATHKGRGYVNEPMATLYVFHRRHGFLLSHP